MELIDGKAVSAEIRQEISKEVDILIAAGKSAPHLAAILVGGDGGSETYVAHKMKACEEVGFTSTLLRLEDTITEKELLEEIELMNKDKSIDGFIVQLPLPKHISPEKVNAKIKHTKDVDGFHAINLGRMVLNQPGFLPATPHGILVLLEAYKIDVTGKNCVVIGRSNIVGTPVSILLSRNGNPGNATVTLCHSKTANLSDITQQADIIIAALGKPEFLTGDMVKEGVVIIDVGTTRVESSETKTGFKLKGDVHFESVAPKASYITPVPGGVGPMTIAMLLLNTLHAAKGTYYS